MKKIVILFLSFIVIGTISGLLYINKTQPAIEPKPQSNNPQRFVDETSVPPVDIVITENIPDTQFDFANITQFKIKGEKNNYFVYLPESCSTNEKIILCTDTKEFTIEQVTDSFSFIEPFKNSQTFFAGDYTITINEKDREFLITIENNDTIYLMVSGADYKDITTQIWTIISTFSLESPTL